MLRNRETGDWIGTFEGHQVQCRVASWILMLYMLRLVLQTSLQRGQTSTFDWGLGESSCTDIGGERLWDVRSGKIVQTLDTKSSVTNAEVSQDGLHRHSSSTSISPLPQDLHRLRISTASGSPLPQDLHLCS
ncbi:hypothetical protein Dimus_031730 [Dionaea muscipula]